MLIEVGGFFYTLPDGIDMKNGNYSEDIRNRMGNGKEWVRDLFYAGAGWANISHVLKTCYPTKWPNREFEREWDKKYYTFAPIYKTSFEDFWVLIKKYF